MKGSRGIILLATVATAVATGRLGLWQLDRAAQKQALQAAAVRQGQRPEVGQADLVAGAADSRELVQRRARLQGQWLADAGVHLLNRSMDGRTGFYVVTPLLLDDGRVLPVQRGWLPRDASDLTRLAPYTTPSGRVTVHGRLLPGVSRIYSLGNDGGGPIRQNLDPAQLARDLRKPLLPLALVEDATPFNAADGLGRNWPQPSSDVHKHHGYAFQWFALSALVIVLYVWFQVIRPRRRRSP